MTAQTCLTISHIAIFVGLVVSAAGGFGQYYYGNKVNAILQNKTNVKIESVDDKVAGVDNRIIDLDSKLSLLVETSDSQKHKWKETVVRAPAIADYVFLIFRSTGGRISGNCRIKGTDVIYPFSTIVNDKTMLAVKNKWQEDKMNYVQDPILEYEITEKSQDPDTLRIFTAGYKMANMGMGFPR